MNAVSVAGEVATIGAGARLGDVYRSLSEDERTIPAGSCPSVGIAGVTLGGGLGILGRKYGVTSDRLELRSFSPTVASSTAMPTTTESCFGHFVGPVRAISESLHRSSSARFRRHLPQTST